MKGDEITNAMLESMSESYRAPEVEFGKASYMSDFYSMGKILYFMLTGEDPGYILDYDNFDNPYISGILEGLLQEDPERRAMFASINICDLIEEALLYEEKYEESRGLNRVIGLEDHKGYLKRSFVDIIQNADLASYYNLKPRKAWLIYGPAGCGKSFFCKSRG